MVTSEFVTMPAVMQAHRLDRVLGREVFDVGVDRRPAGDLQRGGANAGDLHAEHLQVEAQVLHHVVRAGVADDGGATAVGGGHDGVLGDGVAAFAEHEGAVVTVRRRRLHRVEPGLRLHAEAELVQCLHVRLHGAGAEVAAAGVGQPVGVGLVQQRAQEHDDAAGPAGRLHIHGGQVQDGGAADLEVVRVEPGAFDADAGQHLHDPVDFLDPGKPAQRGGAAVDEAGAQQRDAGILAAVDVHRAGEGAAALDAQVGHLGPAHLDDAVPDDRLQTLDHLQAQVLLALFHPGDGALAGAQLGGELPLGPALGAARLAEQDAYVFSSRLSHAPENITHDL